MGKPVAHLLLFRQPEGKQNQVTRAGQVLALISLLVLLIAHRYLPDSLLVYSAQRPSF
jgi:hypothetical protein